MKKTTSGFTIVELLIVIVVVAILAAISILAYNGIHDRAQRASIQNDLSAAAKKMQLAKAETDTYPTSLPSDLKVSPGNVLSLTVTSDSANQFCINAYGPSNMTGSIGNNRSMSDSLCPAAPIGAPLGGSIPPVPTGTNLVASFSAWTTSGSATYNSATNQICIGLTNGAAISPLVRIEGSTSARFALEAYATQPSPNFTPQSSGLYSSAYYGYDGTTLVQNTANYTGNGNAQALPLSTWTNHQWNIATGPNVAYIRFSISSSSSNYTSDNCYRNPQIMKF